MLCLIIAIAYIINEIKMVGNEFESEIEAFKVIIFHKPIFRPAVFFSVNKLNEIELSRRMEHFPKKVRN